MSIHLEGYFIPNDGISDKSALAGCKSFAKCLSSLTVFWLQMTAPFHPICRVKFLLAFCWTMTYLGDVKCYVHESFQGLLPVPFLPYQYQLQFVLPALYVHYIAGITVQSFIFIMLMVQKPNTGRFYCIIVHYYLSARCPLIRNCLIKLLIVSITFSGSVYCKATNTSSSTENCCLCSHLCTGHHFNSDLLCVSSNGMQ